MMKLLARILNKLRYLRNRFLLRLLTLRYPRLHVAKNVRFIGSPIIETVSNSHIEIGENTVIVSKKYFNPLGLNKKSILRTLKPGASIKIGKNVGMSGVTICSMELVEIHDNVGIGANSMILDTDMHPMNPRLPKSQWDDLNLTKTAPVIIEENVMIGMNVVIMKGVRIGKYSIIGANCLIVKDVEPYSIYGSSPAKMIKKLM